MPATGRELSDFSHYDASAERLVARAIFRNIDSLADNEVNSS
jgi:hypothetical protein